MVEKLPPNVKKCPLGFEACLGNFCKSYLKDNREIKCIFPKKVREKSFADRVRRYAKKHLYQPLYEREGGKCQHCGNQNKNEFQIHHIRYTNNLDDLELLCRACHERLHILSSHKRFLLKIIDRLEMYGQDMKIKDVIQELKQKVEENKYDWKPDKY